MTSLIEVQNVSKSYWRDKIEIPVLTAFENVELPLLLTKLSKSQRKKQVETALTLVGLGDRMHHSPKQLSGGQNRELR